MRMVKEFEDVFLIEYLQRVVKRRKRNDRISAEMAKLWGGKSTTTVDRDLR